MNTDVLWPEPAWAEIQVLRIQAKLHRWATEDPDRRFDDLFNLVYDPAVLVVAWARVRGNRGKRSAGVDGIRPDAIFSAEEEFLPRLREDLKARQFAPLPVRERMIPKPGSSKRRRLGIPTARDRTVQAAVKRSDLAGWAEYGYCASHSRLFWGLRLHLVATLHGLPIGVALTGAKADERQVLLDLLAGDPTLAASRPGQILLADKNYFGREFEASIAERGIQLLRRARKGEPERPGGRFFKPLRQTVESIFDTLKGQLDLEQHGGRTPTGVLARVLQRMLAMTCAIWHNDHTGQPVRRSLLAYDH